MQQLGPAERLHVAGTAGAPQSSRADPGVWRRRHLPAGHVGAPAHQNAAEPENEYQRGQRAKPFFLFDAGVEGVGERERQQEGVSIQVGVRVSSAAGDRPPPVRISHSDPR